jgi:hypothetical protein
VSPSNSKLLAVVALVITFGVGAVVGIVGDRILRLLPPSKHSAEFITRRLDRRLHFDEVQRTQVATIIFRHQQRIAVIWSGVRPAVRQEIEQTNVEIDRVLTPQQRVEFDKIRMHLMPRRTGDAIRFQHD